MKRIHIGNADSAAEMPHVKYLDQDVNSSKPTSALSQAALKTASPSLSLVHTNKTRPFP